MAVEAAAAAAAADDDDDDEDDDGDAYCRERTGCTVVAYVHAPRIESRASRGPW